MSTAIRRIACRTMTRFILQSNCSHMLPTLCPMRSISSLAVLAHPLFSPPRSLNSSHCNSPLWVGNFHVLFDEAFDSTSTCGDKRHWLVTAGCNAVQFDSQKALHDYYIEFLAPFIGSEEEAMKKIYLASCGPLFGVGVEMDEDTKNKLEDEGSNICEDCYYSSWSKNTSDQFAGQTAAQFTPMNKNRRLDNIFSYHYLSERNSRWNSDYWLIIPKRSNGGPSHEQRAAYCGKILSDVLGSAEEAKARIYIIWFEAPFGFAAKIDEETAEKLKGLQDVLEVLPDYAFDVVDKDTFFGHRVLFITT